MDTERRRPRVEQGRKRVRGFARGELIFDTTRPLLVWEVPYFPTYYVRREDVVVDLVANGRWKSSPGRGRAELLDVKLSQEALDGGAMRYPESPLADLRDLVRFEWEALDEWLEEDEPIYTHPRDPYTRVDILRSSRHVEVFVEGTKVAETHRSTLLFETGLPTRYYMPLSDVRQELLRPSTNETHCPYKGAASYFSVEIDDRAYEDLVWIYRTPLPESHKIAGLVSFYDEKLDVYVDGELQERPKTKVGK